MCLYFITNMSGRRRYVVASTMEDAVKMAKDVEKPRTCELVATTEYYDDLAQLTLLS